MTMISLDYCPGDCGRMTYPRTKNFVYMDAANQAAVREVGALRAVTSVGLCMRCWTAQHDRRVTHSGSTKRRPARRLRSPVMTEADVAKAQAALKAMWADRRARGVAPEGVPADDWAYGNGGLYSWQIP